MVNGCRLCPKLNGESTLEWYWMLGVELQALVVICLKGMFLQCRLHPKMNTKLKFNLPLKEEYLQYLLSWVPSVSRSLAGSLISSTVRVVESLGTQKVTTFSYLQSDYSIDYESNRWNRVFFCDLPLLKKIRCLFRWQATLGIESPSPAWRLFCLVSNSCLPKASGRCGDMARLDTKNWLFQESMNLNPADLLLFC